MRKRSWLFLSLTVLLSAGAALAQDGGVRSVVGNVFLQDATPGDAQIGHANIKGTFRAGQVFVQQASNATIPVVGNNTSVGAGGAIGGSFSAGQQSSIALRGTATATTGFTYGVIGDSRSATGIGVLGSCASGIGVEGTSSSGIGVYGEVNTGGGAGVHARRLGSGGPALIAENTTGGEAAWMFGNLVMKNGKNLVGTTSQGFTVWKTSSDATSGDIRVQGAGAPGNFASIAAGVNNIFMTLERNSFIRVQGRIGTDNVGRFQADVKNFVQADPDDPERDIVYACVEGPEAAAYVRGTGRLVDGAAVVALPRHFQNVTVAEGLTVQVTPLSPDSEGLAVTAKSNTGFSVRELRRGRGSYAFDWEVKAVRRGFTDYKVYRAWDDNLLPNSDRSAAMAGRLKQARQVYDIKYPEPRP
ncbi:MAG: hypothetical protein JST30_06985 [Armatimonadetes bacterium]|nr:hypothetical protein [Armatimonadota bacterium]